MVTALITTWGLISWLTQDVLCILYSLAHVKLEIPISKEIAKMKSSA